MDVTDCPGVYKEAHREPTQEYKSSIVPIFMDEMLCQYISTDNNLNAVIECTTSVDLMKGKWWIHSPTKENTYLYWGVNQLCPHPWRCFCQRQKREQLMHAAVRLYMYVHIFGHRKHNGDLSLFYHKTCLCFFFFPPSLLFRLPVLLSPGSPDTVVESRAMMRVLVKPGE